MGGSTAGASEALAKSVRAEPGALRAASWASNSGADGNCATGVHSWHEVQLPPGPSSAGASLLPP